MSLGAYAQFEFSIRWLDPFHQIPGIVSYTASSLWFTMQMGKPNTDSAGYAVRFGGVWLEYHERIEYAERELANCQFLCNELTAERDTLLAEKSELHNRFKASIASLTQTETAHMEDKQIFEQVRDEHANMSRRCLAAEAHNEWLLDQLKQSSVKQDIKIEEIASLQYRVDKLKSSVADGLAVQDSLKATLAQKDAQILSLQSQLKSRDEEIVVQSRSMLSKDRQIALLVKERNAFKDDLTDTQRSLALARRTGAVTRKIGADGAKHTLLQGRPADKSGVETHSGSMVTAAASRGDSACNGVTTATSLGSNRGNPDTPDTSMAVDGPETSENNAPVKNGVTTCAANNNHTTPRGSHTSNATTILRRYKSSLQSRNSCGTDESKNDGSRGVTGAFDRHPVLLEDILQSVLSPDEVSSGHDHGADLSNTSNSNQTCMDVATANHASENTAEGINNPILCTPTGRKSPVLDNDAITATTLHLDDLDLDYIDDILDTSADTVCKGRRSGIVVSNGADECSNNNESMRDDGSHIAGSAVVNKMLFGASPQPNKSKVACGGDRKAATNSASNSTSSVGISGSITRTSAVVTANPWAAVPSAKTANASNRSRSSINSTTNSTSNSSTNSSINNITDGSSNHLNVSVYIQRERDYKSALYLLQEEVRLLRQQAARQEAAKRTVRGTPKKTAVHITSTSVIHQ